MLSIANLHVVDTLKDSGTSKDSPLIRWNWNRQGIKNRKQVNKFSMDINGDRQMEMIFSMDKQVNKFSMDIN
jgi:hypothetical protein